MSTIALPNGAGAYSEDNSVTAAVVTYDDSVLPTLGAAQMQAAIDALKASLPLSSILTAPVSSSVLTLTASGLAVTLKANTNYRIEVIYPQVTAVNTTGLRWAVQFTGTLTALSVAGYSSLTQTTLTMPSELTALNTLFFPGNAGPTTARQGYIWGTIRVGANGGVLSLDFASGVNTSQVTILAGAVLTAIPLNHSGAT